MTFRPLAALAMSLALGLAASAQAQTSALPQTPAGEAVRVWLEALNSDDPKVARDERQALARMDTLGLDVVAVEKAADTEVVALVRTRLTGNYARATWQLSGGAEPRVLNLGLRNAPRPPGAPGIERLDDAALGAFVRDFMQRADYSGVFLVARDGKPVVSEVRGLADREAGTPITTASRFRVGSMNKMMTATAILQLAQAGKLRLDAPIGTYLKDYPNADFARTVTVHQLLSHTGGAGDIFGPQFQAKRLELKTLKDFVALYGNRPPEFTPGSDFRYANYGFILLGRIVEEVSGQAYADYLRDHIFRPAGMTGSGFEPETANVPGRTKGYMRTAAGYASNLDTLPWSGTSAGGGYATAGDLLVFARALSANKLLDAEHTRFLTTKKAGPNYAYGFEEEVRDGVRVYGHGGGAPGMNGDLRIFGDGGLVVVALTNVAPPGRANQLTRQILDRAQP